MILRVST